MSGYDTLWAACITLGVLALMLGPLERAFPARRGQPILRLAWATDLAFFVGQALLFNGLVFMALRATERLVDGAVPAIQQTVYGWPLWAQIAAAILGGDLAIYWMHRAQHRFEWLWRFHGVHHTAERLDWLAAFREHPVDGLITRLTINLPGIILGVDFGTMAGLIVFRGLWATFIHSNVRMNLGPLEWVLGSPALHHWHHALDRRAGNYANLNPLMDLLFGTYLRPDHEPVEVGVDTPWPRSYLGLLLHPFVPRRWRGEGRGG